MYSCLETVRTNLQAIWAALMKLAEDQGARLRVGVIAHGDYCDKASGLYAIKFLPLLRVDREVEDAGRRDKLRDFIANAEPTFGGDPEECYELALAFAHNKMKWTQHNSRRLVVMVGDHLPHEPGYDIGNGKTVTINWRDQLKLLRRDRIRVYAVQCEAHDLQRRAIPEFWQRVADDTRGARLTPESMQTVPVLLRAAVAAELGPKAWAAEQQRLRRQGMSRDVQRVVTIIRERVVEHVRVGAGGRGGGRGGRAAGGGGGRGRGAAAGRATHKVHHRRPGAS